MARDDDPERRCNNESRTDTAFLRMSLHRARPNKEEEIEGPLNL